MLPSGHCGPSSTESTQLDLNPMALGLRDHRQRLETQASFPHGLTLMMHPLSIEYHLRYCSACVLFSSSHRCGILGWMFASRCLIMYKVLLIISYANACAHTFSRQSKMPYHFGSHHSAWKWNRKHRSAHPPYACSHSYEHQRGCPCRTGLWDGRSGTGLSRPPAIQHYTSLVPRARPGEGDNVGEWDVLED